MYEEQSSRWGEEASMTGPVLTVWAVKSILDLWGKLSIKRKVLGNNFTVVHEQTLN